MRDDQREKGYSQGQARPLLPLAPHPVGSLTAQLLRLLGLDPLVGHAVNLLGYNSISKKQQRKER